jgi:hypothetical protein
MDVECMCSGCDGGGREKQLAGSGCVWSTARSSEGRMVEAGFPYLASDCWAWDSVSRCLSPRVIKRAPFRPSADSSIQMDLKQSIYICIRH